MLTFRVKYQEGIHFPMINQLLSIVRENEKISKNLRTGKLMYINEVKKQNADKYEELSQNLEEFDPYDG